MKKIHTKIKINIETGEVLEDEFFWYEGPFALCDDDGGDDDDNDGGDVDDTGSPSFGGTAGMDPADIGSWGGDEGGGSSGGGSSSGGGDEGTYGAFSEAEQADNWGAGTTTAAIAEQDAQAAASEITGLPPAEQTVDVPPNYDVNEGVVNNPTSGMTDEQAQAATDAYESSLSSVMGKIGAVPKAIEALVATIVGFIAGGPLGVAIVGLPAVATWYSASQKEKAEATAALKAAGLTEADITSATSKADQAAATAKADGSIDANTQPGGTDPGDTQDTSLTNPTDTTTGSGLMAGNLSAADQRAQSEAELAQLQVDQAKRVDAMLEKLWPDIEALNATEIGSQESYAALTKLQADAEANLVPLKEELAKKGIDLESIKLDEAARVIERNQGLETALLGVYGLKKDETTGEYVSTGETGADDDIYGKLREKYGASLTDDVPVSPGLERDLETERQKLENTLAAKLGPNWATTTPGIQALAQFEEQAKIARADDRRKTQADTGTQYMNYMGLLGNVETQKGQNIRGVMDSGQPQTAPVNTGLLAGTSPGSGFQIPTITAPGSAGLNAVTNTANANQQQSNWQAEYEAGQKAGRINTIFGLGNLGANVGKNISDGSGGNYSGYGTAAGLLAGYLLS